MCEGGGYGMSFRSSMFLSEAGQSFREVVEISLRRGEVRIGKDDFQHFRRYINKPKIRWTGLANSFIYQQSYENMRNSLKILRIDCSGQHQII